MHLPINVIDKAIGSNVVAYDKYSEGLITPRLVTVMQQVFREQRCDKMTALYYPSCYVTLMLSPMTLDFTLEPYHNYKELLDYYYQCGGTLPNTGDSWPAKGLLIGESNHTNSYILGTV